MEELSSPKFLCKRQRLTCSTLQPYRKHLLLVRCYDARHHDWSWMLCCWHYTMFRDIIPKCYDLRPTHSVCWRQYQRWKFLHRKKIRIRFPWLFTSFNNWCSSPDVSGTLMHSTEVTWNVLDTFFLFFKSSWTQWRLKFSSSVPVLSFSCTGRFEGFLMTSACSLTSSWWKTIL